jgi:hypothetical protein
MKFNPIKQAFIALIFISLMVSCEYEVIEIALPPAPPPVDTTDSTAYKISFAQAIAPIFTNDNCVTCHNGSMVFDLSEANAYNSIISNDLVVPFDPTASIIYTYPHPSIGSHNSKYSSVAETDSIALWIYQGALDN